jgi:Amt family ammonium transporter
MKRMGIVCCVALTLVLLAVPLLAQQSPASTSPATPSASASSPEIPPAVTEKLNQLEQKVTAAQYSADNAWMLVSAALVLMMTGPGLALFYGGLVRQKNVLAIMMQSFVLMALITVLWALVGYSLCFGGSGPFIGDFHMALLRGVGAVPNPDYAGTIPQSTFMVYQLMFAIITPALITGATAERMKFSDIVVPSGVCADGAHGLGQGRIPECFARRTIPDAGFCGWNRCARYFGCFRACLRALPG